MAAIIIAVLVTWTIMGALYFVIDNTGSEIAKYIIAAPVIVILVWPIKIVKKILKKSLRKRRTSHGKCI